MHIPPDPDPSAWVIPSTTDRESPLMTLTKEAITRSVFDRLDLQKAASTKAVEATVEIIKKILAVEFLPFLSLRLRIRNRKTVFDQRSKDRQQWCLPQNKKYIRL
jgi:nucleoid DNA-binding protein